MNKKKGPKTGHDLYLDEGDIIRRDFDERNGAGIYGELSDSDQDLLDELPYSSAHSSFEGFDIESDIIDIPTLELEALSEGKGLLRRLFYKSNIDIRSDEGKILDEVLGFFGEIIDHLDLTNGLFLKMEEATEVFAQTFDVYNFQLNVEIAKIEGEIGFFDECSRFYEGWQERVRKAAYFAFFVHFGAKRRFEYYEIDGQKMKKDYISHVFGASFESLIDKIHFLDEEILLATLLHDTREDFAKGFLGLLNMSEENGDIPEDLQRALYSGVDKKSLAVREIKLREKEILNSFEQMEKSLDIPQFMISISEYVKILTKSSSDRNEAIISFLERMMHFHMGWKVMLAKMADRHNNMRTFSSGLRVDKGECAQQIEDETAKIYLKICLETGMVNLADWFMDYLEFQNRMKRGEWDRLNVNTEIKTGMKKRFMEEFQDRLSRYVPGVRLGVDYILEFRTIGYRWLDRDQVPDDPIQYSRKLRSYIIFIPKNEFAFLIRSASKVFDQIFVANTDRSDEERIELQSKLGHTILNRGGFGRDDRENGYGEGVYGVFPSQKVYAAEMLGDFHLAYFHGDKASMANIEDLFASIQRDTSMLSKYYQNLEVAFDIPSSGPAIDTARGAISGRVLNIFLRERKDH